MVRNTKTRPTHPELVERIVAILNVLPGDRVQVIADFVSQAKALDDPDVLNTFVTWRNDPRLDTLLLLSSQLTEDDVDQIIFFAEDQFMQNGKVEK